MNTDEIRMLLHAASAELTRLRDLEKQLMKERGELMADKRRLDWLKTDPYGRLQKVRVALPTAFYPADMANDPIRAAIDAAMKP